MEDTIEEGVRPQSGLASHQGAVRRGEGRQVEGGGRVDHSDAREKDLAEPWVHVVAGKDFM